MRICKKCNNVISDTAKYCRYCGEKLSEVDKFYCEECGTELIPSDGYCEKCGRKAFAENKMLTYESEASNIRLEDNGALLDAFEYVKYSNGEIAISGLKDTNLCSVYFPYGVVSILDGAFEGTNIVDVVCPSTLKRIGKRAFANCMNLVAISINDGLLVIDDEAFADDCELFFSIPDKIVKIGKDAFKNTKIEKCCQQSHQYLRFSKLQV